MKRQVRAQLSILLGVLGFFAGGLINSGKEIVDVMLGAAVGWGLVFFTTYLILKNIYIDADEVKTQDEKPAARRAVLKAEKNKGKKIDIIVKSDDTFDHIYKLK